MIVTMHTTQIFCIHDSDLHNLIFRLERDSVLAIEWFECINIKLNKDNFYLLISWHKYESVWANIGSYKI